MKTALLLSCLLAGGSMITTRYFAGSDNTHTSATLEYRAPSSVYNHPTTKRVFASAPVAPVKIVIDKSDYELHVYDSKGWYATYPVVFGNDPLKDKKMEGDRCTPEGTFKVISKRYHEKWHRFMALDYPTKESLAKFNQRKAKGEIPKTATVGGGIGIHGVFPHEDFVIDRYNNWTMGCISLKNPDVQELYSYISTGTPVEIRK
jgi:murein L,D-transpeptidase YafK